MILKILLAMSMLLLSYRETLADNIHSEIKICDDSYPPYIYVSENKLVKGLSYDLLTRILNRNNISYHYSRMKRKKCLAGIKKGDITMSSISSYSIERQRYALFSIPFDMVHQAVFYKRGYVFKEKNILLAISGKICGVEGYNYETFTTNNVNFLDFYPNEVILFKQLRNINSNCKFVPGRLETILARNVLGQVKLSGLKARVLTFFTPVTFYFIISKKYKHSNDLLIIINNSLRQITTDGDFTSIYKYYVGKNPSPKLLRLIK